MSRRHDRRHKSESYSEPDLPITPMLDMSFQLLAYFLMTFNPTLPEGHLDMALPKVDGGANAAPPASMLDEDAEELTVSVTPDVNGGIGSISIRTKEATVAKPLGANSSALFEELRGRLAGGKKASKVKLELGDTLSYKIVVKMIDEINRAGYRNVAPALLGAAGK